MACRHTVDIGHAQSMAVDPQDTESLSVRLKQLGISQAEFAAICEVTAKTVSNWVKGRTRVNPTALAFLDQIEASAGLRWRLCVGDRLKGAPRGKPFAKGNPYRFGDRRRALAVARARMARTAAFVPHATFISSRSAWWHNAGMKPQKKMSHAGMAGGVYPSSRDLRKRSVQARKT
jgi:transcriptional regulator with XRE-family HTH domain